MGSRIINSLSAAMVCMALPFTLALTFTFVAPAHAQTRSYDPPANAHKKSYGGGSECNPGFQEKAGACVATVVPENAYGTNASYGRAWECNRGYRRSEEACAEVSVPENAYLNSSGVSVGRVFGTKGGLN